MPLLHCRSHPEPRWPQEEWLRTQDLMIDGTPLKVIKWLVNVRNMLQRLLESFSVVLYKEILGLGLQDGRIRWPASSVSHIDFWNFIHTSATIPDGDHAILTTTETDDLAEGVEQILIEETYHPGTLSTEQVKQIRQIETRDPFAPNQTEPIDWLTPSSPPEFSTTPDPNECTDCVYVSDMEGVDAHEWERKNRASIDLAKSLPVLTTDEGWISPVPIEYSSLTLDGKITYTARLGVHVYNTALRFEDGSPAAVGPTNTLLDPSYELDPDGHVLSYNGTTIEDVDIWRRQIPFWTQERKNVYNAIITEWNNMELRTYSIRREEVSLAAWESRPGRKRGSRRARR